MREGPKQTVESSLVLDCWKLARDGCLVGGWSGSIQWIRGHQLVDSIGLEAKANPDALELIYAISNIRTGRTEQYSYHVGLIRTPAAVGGERTWFGCWKCGARVRKLYLPPGGRRFLCRRCHKLAYSSQNLSRKGHVLARFLREEEPLERALRRGYREMSPKREAADRRASEATVALFARWNKRDQREREREQERQQPRRRPGRPSKREVREAERARHSEARNLAPSQKRSRGRPRLRRAYVRRQALPTLSEHRPGAQAYCVRCRDRRALTEPTLTRLANGRAAIRGRCATCGAVAARIVAAREVVAGGALEHPDGISTAWCNAPDAHVRARPPTKSATAVGETLHA